MIEAFWRQLKHNWLYLTELDSLSKLHDLIAFYGAVCQDILQCCLPEHSALS